MSRKKDEYQRGVQIKDRIWSDMRAGDMVKYYHKQRYSFGMAVREIRSIDKILYLLGEDCKKRGSSSYYGKIEGISVRIGFKVDNLCTLCVENREDLEKAVEAARKLLAKKKEMDLRR